MDEELMTVKQVCARLQVCRSTLYAWWARGTGPRSIVLPGGDRRVRPEWLRDWEGGQEA
jgi:predicted DNA-binding transcriptional regulator AlpA